MKGKGVFFGILAAVCYGTNPLGALPLYDEGVNTASVLVYRFSTAVAMLAVLLVTGHQSFCVSRRDMSTLAPLGVLFAISSITYYHSFRFMDAGIASTILFVYPVMVAVIMSAFFKEHITASTVAAISLALTGTALLYEGGRDVSLSVTGIVLVMLSALSYAVYIVIVNQSNIRMTTIKLTFHVMLICLVTLLVYSLSSPDMTLVMPPSPRAWFFACWLGLVPTVLSLVFMTKAVHMVGATATAIMGALEPLTAVSIGVMLFGESLTARLITGVALILFAVALIVLGKNNQLHAIRSSLSSIVKRRWRWRS